MIYYLVFLGVVGLQRVIELVISKRNWRNHSKRAELLQEPLFRWMVLLHASMFVVLPVELLIRQPAFGGWLSWVSIAMTVFIFVLRYWTLSTIGKSWNVRVVYADDYPIVSNGPYRFIRHPNYAVVILELLFIPLIYHLYFSAIFLSLANALVLRVRIRNEEAVLFKNPQWREKMAQKPRFFPGF